ncbi:helix-turn-helix transcriptional regulator [Serratia surfactantfaciens]|uniref:helix-turn-helix transcriptional regulator n=1 Tax=Serratia surfactantfaciens TaxID=2741499 RepID=UPI003EE0316E
MECREKIFKKTIKLIDKNIAGDLSIDNLCAITGCQVWDLRRLFKKQAGINIGKYIRTRRLKKAALLLKSTEESVSNIAVATGFKSQQSFTRSFRRFFNDTPHSFRMRDIRMKKGLNIYSDKIWILPASF